MIFSLQRKRTNDIVRLVSCEFHHLIIKASYDVSYSPKARPKIVRHLFTSGLVLRVFNVTERNTCIENHGQVLGLKILSYVKQETSEPEGRRGVLTCRIRERSLDKGEVRTVDQRIGVNQENPGSVLGGHPQRTRSSLKKAPHGWKAGGALGPIAQECSHSGNISSLKTEI